MKAVQINQYGSADSVIVTEIKKPEVGKKQVLIEVHASSLNPVDVKIREGYMANGLSVKPPFTLGVDIAGIVAELGEGAEGVNVGDKVYGLAGVMAGVSGAFAEYATAKASMIARMPKNLTFIEAAVMPLTGVSAIEALYENIKLEPDQKILIHGGAGGIGTMAIQIAKHIGAFVATTVGTHEMNYAKNLGVDQVIDYKNQKFDEILKDFDAVYDTVGGGTYTKSFKVLKRGGIIVSMLEPPNEIMMEAYGVKAVYEGAKIDTKHLDELTELIEKGFVKPHIFKIYNLDGIKDAFRAKEAGMVQGKIAIEVKK